MDGPMRREFLGQLIRREERLPAEVSFSLTLRKAEVGAETYAELELRLALPDGSVLHCSGGMTQRELMTAADTLEGLADGTRETAYIEDDDYSFTLTANRVAGNETEVVLDGQLSMLSDDTAIDKRWRGNITEHRRGRPRVTLQGLILTRSDMGVLAALVRDFLAAVGDELPEHSVYVDS
jgi:hypothetical protein